MNIMNMILGWSILLGALVGLAFSVGKALYWLHWLRSADHMYIGEMEMMHRVEGLRRDLIREPVRTWFQVVRWWVMSGALAGFAIENFIHMFH